MPHCSIRACGKSSVNSSSKVDGITFHRFSKDPELQKKWIAAADRGVGWLPTHYSFVCSRHFTENSFRTVGVTQRRCINSSAVPTLFLPTKINNIPHSSPNTFEKHKNVQTKCLTESTGEPAESAECAPELNRDPVYRRLSIQVYDLNKMVDSKSKLLKQSRDYARRLETKLETLKIEIEELRKQQNDIKFSNGKSTHPIPSTSNLPVNTIKSEPTNVSETEDQDILLKNSIERILRRKITELNRKLEESKQASLRVRKANTSLKKILNMYKVIIKKMKKEGSLTSEDVSVERLKSANRSLVEKIGLLKKQLAEERRKNQEQADKCGVVSLG